ncbi:hypothetical protein EVAR_39098_1 [Eumeta japonica]|uniref:Uncharacterized protein n=1 Tax=Eumeta variegata TaxID=151549 RepID=A0A4C1X7S7_EUMVA|nr:hypothetical protein EVAR_39098_1 [Eumeta japonica]
MQVRSAMHYGVTRSADLDNLLILTPKKLQLSQLAQTLQQRIVSNTTVIGMLPGITGTTSEAPHASKRKIRSRILVTEAEHSG